MTEQKSDWPAHISSVDGLVDAGFAVPGAQLSDEQRVVLAAQAE